MPTRSHSDPFSIIDTTKMVEKLPKTTKFMTAMDLVDADTTAHTTFEMDVVTHSYQLLASSSFTAPKPNLGKGYEAEKKSMGFHYFLSQDTVTKADYMGKVVPGTVDTEEAKANVARRKMAQQKLAWEQTKEYMILQAAQGSCITPDGKVLADMFALLNVTRPIFYMDLDGANFDIGTMCRQYRKFYAQNLTNGATAPAVLPMVVTDEVFEKIVTHPTTTARYYNSESNVSYQQARDKYTEFGATSYFETNGVAFITYDHTFVLPDGTTESTIRQGDGFSVPKANGSKLMNVMYGPSRSMNSTGGREFHSTQKIDPWGIEDELIMESNITVWNSVPTTSILIEAGPKP